MNTKNVLKKLKTIKQSWLAIIIIGLILISCADVSDTANVVGSAVGGATTVKVVEKVKEVFTPHFPLIVNPSEICDITDEEFVTCYVIPCSDDSETNCEIKTEKEKWFLDNPKVYTLRSASVIEILNFCGRNEGSCEDYLGEYSAGKIILVRD